MAARPNYIPPDLTYVGVKYSGASYGREQFQVWKDPQGNLRSYGNPNRGRGR